MPKDRTDTVHPAFTESRIFAGLTPTQQAQAVSAFRPRKCERGEPIFLEGSPAQTYYLIAEGQVKILQTSAEGFEVILHVLGPGELIGALPTLGEGSYPASAVAMDEVLVYAVSPESFEDLLHRYPSVTLQLLRFAAGVIQTSHRRLRELATERVERRIARTLARLAGQMGRQGEQGIELGAPLSRQELADMCGTTVFTVSRTLKSWERAGILRAKREHLTILDTHALTEIGEDLPKEQPSR